MPCTLTLYPVTAPLCRLIQDFLSSDRTETYRPCTGCAAFCLPSIAAPASCSRELTCDGLQIVPCGTPSANKKGPGSANSGELTWLRWSLCDLIAVIWPLFKLVSTEYGRWLCCDHMGSRINGLMWFQGYFNQSRYFCIIFNRFFSRILWCGLYSACSVIGLIIITQNNISIILADGKGHHYAIYGSRYK